MLRKQERPLWRHVGYSLWSAVIPLLSCTACPWIPHSIITWIHVNHVLHYLEINIISEPLVGRYNTAPRTREMRTWCVVILTPLHVCRTRSKRYIILENWPDIKIKFLNDFWFLAVLILTIQQVQSVSHHRTWCSLNVADSKDQADWCR